MQTSKEVVKAAVEFTTPERLPVIFGRLGDTDVHRVGWNQIGTGDNEKPYTLDEWQCGWQRTDVRNMGQVKTHPLDEWDNLTGFRWPNPDDPAFYAGMEEKFAGSDGKYITTGIFMLLFERLHSLRGFENMLGDLYLEKEKISDLADRIVEFDLEIIKNINSRFPGRIDGFTFTDDWGTEQALIVSPALWREFFMPRYKRIFDACHKAGWHVWMHSCGKVNEAIPMLIEIGCNVLDLQQPRLLGIEEVGAKFAGKVCFQSTCDIQHTLPIKSVPEIQEEAKLLMECWGTEKGGFILSDYGNEEAIGSTKEKTRVMYDAFISNDRYAKKSGYRRHNI